MVSKSITELNSLTKSDLSENDLLLITDVSAKETKNIEVSEFVSYNNDILNTLSTGSFSGSFYGNLKGFSNTSSFSITSNLSYTSSVLLFNGDVNGTSSYSINNSDTNISITSSNCISSSFSITSSFSVTSSYALNSSSNHSLYSLDASSSFNSDISISSSYLNYYGQDNGTSISSSVSERSLYSKMAENFNTDLALISEVPVAYTLQSDSALSCYQAVQSVTASYTELADESDSALDRLFAAVEFRVDFDNKDNIQITPISWKNIDNIAPPKKAGKYYTDFIVKYKKQPDYPLNRIEEASKLTLSSVGGVQLTEAGLDFEDPSTYSKKDPKASIKLLKRHVPIYHSSVFPCGLEGFVIRFSNYTVYKKEEKAGWLQFLAAGVLIVAGGVLFAVTTLIIAGVISAGAGLGFLIYILLGRDDPNVVNHNPLLIPLKTYLNGRSISAAVFCNVNNFLDQGPVSNLSQYANKIIISSAVNIAITELKFLKSLEITSVDNDDDFVDALQQTFDNVKSIAHSTGNYNLVLLESNSITNISVTDNAGENLKYIYSPRTGSVNDDSVNNLNKIKYNSSSLDYYGVSNTPGKLIYAGSSYINQYDSYDKPTNINLGNFSNEDLDLGTWRSFPLWNTYTHSSLIDKNIISAIGLTETKYILVTDERVTLNFESNPLPIYIVDDITNLSSTISQQNSKLYPSDVTIGLSDAEYDQLDKAAKKVSVGPIRRYQLRLAVNTCKFYDITKISDTEVILVGTNAVVVYGYIDGGDWKWLRVDYLMSTDPTKSTRIKKLINYPLNQYSVKILTNDTVIIVGDSRDNDVDNSARRFGVTLQCKLPTIRNDPNRWDWTTSLWNVVERKNDDPSIIVSEDSSFKDICTNETNFLIAGYNLNTSGSYYYYNYVPGDVSGSLRINCCEKIDNSQFLLGGYTQTDSHKTAFLSIYQQQ
jgi:hypothetical protein